MREFNDRPFALPNKRFARKKAVVRNQHRNKHYSALRERLKREDAAAVAKLTPAERLRVALDLSDFCLLLAAKVREADAQRKPYSARQTTSKKRIANAG